MVLDILAIQRLYGAATSGPLAAGGQVFGFNSNIEGPAKRFFDFSDNRNPVITIWDGGANNTLDLSGFSKKSVVDLNRENSRSANGKINNIAIAIGHDRQIGRHRRWQRCLDRFRHGQHVQRNRGDAHDRRRRRHRHGDILRPAVGLHVDGFGQQGRARHRDPTAPIRWPMSSG